MDPTQTQSEILITISEYLNNIYSEDGLFLSSLEEEQRSIIEFAADCCSKGIHPLTVMSVSAYDELIKITNIKFDKILVDTVDNIIKSINSKKSNINTNTSEQKVDSVNPDKFISCKSYSCGSNLSVDYPYANSVEFATCSNSTMVNASGMYCVAANQQYRCPFYKQDKEEFSSYELTFEDTVYKYSVDKFRHIYGNTIFTIRDQDSNLLNELTFDPETYSKISKEELAIELKNIVNSIHKNLFYKDDYSLTDSLIDSTPVTVSTKSYIATLIS